MIFKLKPKVKLLADKSRFVNVLVYVVFMTYLLHNVIFRNVISSTLVHMSLFQEK